MVMYEYDCPRCKSTISGVDNSKTPPETDEQKKCPACARILEIVMVEEPIYRLVMKHDNE